MFVQPKVFLVYLVFLIGCVRLLSNGQASSPVMIRSWRDQMKDEWFLQVGEPCDVIGDQMDHFAMFFTLGDGGGVRQGIAESIAKNLASRRCLKEKLKKTRTFGCLNGVCDCLDPTKVWEVETQSCRKFDGQRCRKKEECLSGYICDLLEMNPPGAVESRTISLRRVALGFQRIDMNNQEKLFLDYQSEFRRREYIRALVREGEQISALVQGSFDPAKSSGIDYVNAVTVSNALEAKLVDLKQHPLVRAQYVPIGFTYYEIIRYLQPNNQDKLLQPPNSEQKLRLETWLARANALEDEKYLFKDANEYKLDYVKADDAELERVLVSSKNEFFNLKKRVNVDAGKVCHCGGVGSDPTKCVIFKLDRIPSPPRNNRTLNSTGGVNLANFFKPSWSLFLVMFLFVEVSRKF